MNKATRIYSLLLRLYPNSFRREFGAEMVQVFHEQYRAASMKQHAFSLCLRTFADLLWTVPSEHLQEFKKHMNLQSLGRRLSFARLSVAIALCLYATCVIVTFFLLPRVFMSVSRVSVEPANPGTHLAPFDPFLLQTTAEQIKSRRVLDPVIEELGLARWFEEELGDGSKLKTSDVYQILRGAIAVQQIRNTTLLDIRAFSKDPRMSAEIANKIAEVLKRTQLRADYSTLMVDRAEPERRAVRPNVPFNMVMGFVVSVFAALVLAGLIRLAIRVFARPARAAV